MRGGLKVRSFGDKHGGNRGVIAVVAALCFTVALTACGSSPQPAPKSSFAPGQEVPAGFPDAVAYAAQVVAATNAARAAEGVPELAPLQCAQEIAASRVRLVLPMGDLQHPDADLICQGFNMGGENLVHGIYLPNQAVDAWLGSPGHRSNVLSPNFTHIGVACVATSLENPTLEATPDAPVGGMLCSQVFAGNG